MLKTKRKTFADQLEELTKKEEDLRHMHKVDPIHMQLKAIELKK